MNRRKVKPHSFPFLVLILIIKQLILNNCRPSSIKRVISDKWDVTKERDGAHLCAEGQLLGQAQHHRLEVQGQALDGLVAAREEVRGLLRQKSQRAPPKVALVHVPRQERNVQSHQ